MTILNCNWTLILDDQMKILDKVKRDELLKVEEETSKLHQQSQEMKRFEEKGLELMDQKGSLNFIIESNALLQKRHLAEMTHGSQNTWTHTAEPVYQRPIYWQAAESEEFRQLIQDQILGQLRIQETTTNRKFNRDWGARNPTSRQQLPGV